MSFFRTWDEAGKNLVDSDFITYGLIRCGSMAKITDAYRNNGVLPYYDEVYGFTITGAISPIIFIAGRGVFQQVVRSGNSLTYWYAHASTSTRFYVFDQMRDLGAGPAKLRLWDIASVCTLDSMMPFMDINGKVIPPDPVLDSAGYGRGYAGATTISGSANGPNPDHGNATILMDLYAVPVGGDCAVNLTWSRYVSHSDKFGFYRFSALEGAYGEGANVVFIMATEAGCVVNDNVLTTPNTFFDIARPRKPTAMYIDATTLPFPYSV